jgi:hypothetical protein
MLTIHKLPHFVYEKCVQNFGAETSLETSSWETRKGWEDKTGMDLKETGCVVVLLPYVS